MSGWFLPEEEIIDTFRHLAGTTGIADGSWTKLLFRNGVASSLPVIITEISGGYYKAAFTPDSEGLWFLHVHVTAAATNLYEGRYNVWSILNHIGGSDYDPRKHSLRTIRGAVGLVRADQVVGQGLSDGKEEKKFQGR
jgi:hypothetical protein